jgi:hypothetical protein
MTTTHTPVLAHEVSFRTERRGDVYVARVRCDCGGLDRILEHSTSRSNLIHMAGSLYQRHVMTSGPANA